MATLHGKTWSQLLLLTARRAMQAAAALPAGDNLPRDVFGTNKNLPIRFLRQLNRMNRRTEKKEHPRIPHAEHIKNQLLNSLEGVSRLFF